jgi:hypothetical protein
MSLNSDADLAGTGVDPAPKRTRPPVVDYACYALVLRCVLSLAAAFSLYGARGELTKSLADTNKSKNWSAQTLHSNVDAALRANVITTLISVVLVAILIKYLRDGKGWARLIYLAFAVLITRDIFQVFGFAQYHNFAVRTLTGLVGVSAIVAIVLLFLPAASAYFRPAGGGGAGLMAGMFGARRGMAAAGPRQRGAGPRERGAGPSPTSGTAAPAARARATRQRPTRASTQSPGPTAAGRPRGKSRTSRPADAADSGGDTGQV